MKYILNKIDPGRRGRFRIAAAAGLLFTTLACSSDFKPTALFEPLAGALGLGSANTAFSNDLNDPANLPTDVAVTQPPQAAAGSAPVRGIIAIDKARLGRWAQVDADVSVLSESDGHYKGRLVLHRGARMEAERIARADYIKLRKRAKILGTAEYNTIKLGKHASVAEQVTPLGDLPLLPPFLTGAPGTQKITYQDSPLAAGNYGKLKLKKKKSLVLTGGIYHFTDIRLFRRSSLICETTCVLLVKNRLRASRHTNLAAMSAKSSDLIVYVEGETPHHGDGPHHHRASVRLHKRTHTTADIYAPNGKVRVGRRASYTGNIIGKRVVIARGTHVVSGAEVPRRVAKLIKAGEAGVVEIPGEIRLEIPACALSEDKVISITPGPTFKPFTPITPAGFVTRGPSYDLGPDGLQFDCAVRVVQKFDAGAFSDAGVNESDLKVYTASLGGPFFPAPGTVDQANDTINADITHFSLSIVGTAPAGVSRRPWALVIDGNRAYGTYYGEFAVPNGEGLRIFDISNPAAPTLNGTFAPSNLGTSGLHIDGNTAYVIDAQLEPTPTRSGLRVLDVTNPASITQTASVPTPVSSPALTQFNLAVFGNRAYSACPFSLTEWALCIWNISNPAAPTYVGQTGPVSVGGLVGRIRVSGNLLFVTSNGTSDVKSFDLTDPDNPALVDTFSFASGNITRMRIVGSRIYLEQNQNMEILTFDGAGNMSAAGSYITADTVTAVDARGNTAVVSTLTELIELDVTDAANITEISRITIPFSYVVRMTDTHAYALAADPADGLIAVALSSTAASCKSLPATWNMALTAPVSSNFVYNCIASGLDYICSDAGASAPTVTYSFASAAAANLGVIDAPVIALDLILPGFRGTSVSITGLSSDYTLDGNNRLTSFTQTPNTVALSNYDVNGFPMTASGPVNATFAYTYGAGGSIPTRITGSPSIAGNGIADALDYAGGVMTAFSFNGGSTTGTASTSGSVQICDPPPPTGSTPPDAVGRSLGFDFSCAIDNGGVQCWGANDRGQLGNGTTTPSLTPVPVTGLTSNVVQVEMGLNHACAILTDGSVQCWGSNAKGQLGDGTTLDRTTPVAVPAFAGGGVTRIALGTEHSCAIQSGTAMCWGNNSGGLLGTNDPLPENPVPAPITALPGPVTDIDTNAVHVCAVSGGQVYCWGVGSFGLMGDGTLTTRSAPTNPVNGLSNTTRVSVGQLFACAIDNGGVQCWGANNALQLGVLVPGVFQSSPVAITELSSGVTAMQSGSHHSCAVLSDGSARCWGRNVSGELAQGNNNILQGILQPLDASLNPLTNVTAISVGERHNCAIADGAFKCWGLNTTGQLGDGTTVNQLTASDGPSF